MANKSELKSTRNKVLYSAEEGPNVDSKPSLIRVGEAEQEFYVHKKLLRASSKFFNNALKKEWRGKQEAVNLPDADPDHFRAWVKFIYTGRVFMGQLEEEVKKEKPEYPELETWACLYALGDYLADEDFRDALIDAMCDWMRISGRIPTSIPRWVYPYTTKTSAHRRFAVDVFVKISKRSEIAPLDIAAEPPEFSQDVLACIMPKLYDGIKTTNSDEWFKELDGCEYHDHGDKPCYKIKPAFRF
ncbi:hypothetical protein J4E81_007517 [Alternaria sp. BMP 2799]|nr:hypothetical protein J4E81_007517 [Alternaria sp. BMP 2799]